MNREVNSESWEACYSKIIDYSSPNYLGSDFYSKKTFLVLPSLSCIPNIKKKILNRSFSILPQFVTFDYIEDILLFNSKQKKIEIEIECFDFIKKINIINKNHNPIVFSNEISDIIFKLLKLQIYNSFDEKLINLKEKANLFLHKDFEFKIFLALLDYFGLTDEVVLKQRRLDFVKNINNLFINKKISNVILCDENTDRLSFYSESLKKNKNIYTINVIPNNLNLKISKRKMLCFSDEQQNLNYIVRKIKRVIFKNPQKKINLIPFDYLLSRKLRAIFESDNVYVMDRVGWKMSTTMASSALIDLLDYIGNDRLCYIESVVNNPFLLSDNKIKEELNNFLLKIKNENISEDEKTRCFLEIKSDFLDLLKNLKFSLIKKRTNRVDYFFLKIINFIKQSKYSNFLEDLAGIQLFELLSRFTKLKTKSEFTLVEITQFLKKILEKEEFIDYSIKSNIKFTNYHESKYIIDELKVFFGINKKAFELSNADIKYFNFDFLAEFGISSKQRFIEEKKDIIYTSIKNNDEIYLLANKSKKIEYNPTIYFEDSLINVSRKNCLESKNLLFEKNILEQKTYKLKSLTSIELPVNSIPSLINCSFKFFYEHIIKIKSYDLSYESKNAILRGLIIHRVLEFFHKKYKTYDPDIKIDLTNYLIQLSSKIFKAESGDLYQLNFEQTSFESAIPKYIDHLIFRQQNGWLVQEIEEKKTKSIVLKNGMRVKISGKIDRLDINSKGEICLIDYKTSSSLINNIEVKRIQLDSYRYIINDKPSIMEFWLFNKKGFEVKSINKFEDIQAFENKIISKLEKIFIENQIEPDRCELCKYCHLKNICRINE